MSRVLDTLWRRRGRLGRAAVATLAVLIALSIIGALIPSEDEEDGREAITETTTDDASPETTTEEPETTTAEEDEGAGSQDESTDVGLTGLGATREGWYSRHEPAPGYESDCCFLPLLEGQQPRYYSALWTDSGHIQGFSIRFQPRVRFRQALLAAVEPELPLDAELRSDRTLGLCRILQYRSASYARAIGARVFDVAFYSYGGDELPWDGRVEDVIILPGSPDVRSGC